MSKSKELNILIIEDDAMVMNVIEEFLYKMNQVTITGKASNLTKAKKILQEEKVNLALVDLYLPDGSGLDLLKWIRMENINVDAIVITADQRSMSLEIAKRYGIYDYILKPFKFERFQEAIENFRKRKDLITSKDYVQQHMVDRIITNKNSDVSWKTQTYERIISYLKENPNQSFTSSEIAKILGISRITARKYLEGMELEGVIHLELSYGSVGRPKTNIAMKGNKNVITSIFKTS